MKVKHFFGLAVLAAMTASCSSNDELVNNVSGNEASAVGVGYAAFSINLPTTGSMTRAGEDAGGAIMDGGTKEEYAVKNATALIFHKEGTSEDSYKFVETVSLGNLKWDSDDNTNGVTTKTTKVAKLSSVKDNGEFYALILLNNKKSDGSNIVALPTSNEMTYGDWNKTIQNNVDLITNGFFMANAPRFEGSATAPVALVNIASGKIYSTKEAAENASNNTEVYVERAVAKVDVTDPGTKEVEYNGTKNGDKVTFKNWALDVTNKKTFAIHTYAALSTDYSGIWNKDRFKGTNGRIYWAIDPNYDKDELKTADSDNDTKRNDEFDYIDNTAVTGNFTKAQYCLENTFNLDNMYQGQTTRVVFKSVYTPDGYTTGETFYKVGKTMVKDATALKALINTAAGEVLASCTLVDSPSFLTTAGVHFLTCADLKTSTDAALDETDVKKYNGKSGKEIVADINAKLGLEGYDDNTRPENQEGINTYLKGETYYIARIKHFGDDLTPWQTGETYGSDNAKYLGRYGVLRNNWYELTIGKVSGLGYPDVPPVKPNTPDDEDDKYISVSVKILDWAKRTQSVDL